MSAFDWMIFILVVSAMDLHILAVMLLFYGEVKGAKQALRDGGDIVTVPENNPEGKPSKALALLIVEDIEESEEENPSMENKAPMLPWLKNPEIMLPWIESGKPTDNEEDSSGESNSDEYPDTDTQIDTDRESNYHEDDYLKDKINKEITLLDFEKNLEPLRKRWKSCQRTASKYCRKACVATYKNACKEQKCNSKLKRIFKKQCKQNCIEFFE